MADDSDIQLGEDGTVTVVCRQLVTRDASTTAAPVAVRGDVHLRDRVLLDDKVGLGDAIDPDVAEVYFGSAAKLLDPRTGELAEVSIADTPTYTKGEATGGKVISSPAKLDVYKQLRNRSSPFDLARELGLLRKAVLDLDARLKQLKK